MRRSWSFFYGLHLLGSAYFGMTYRNWLERQFQSGRFDRAFRDERLAVTPLARPKGQLLWVHIDSQETALNLSEFLSRLSDMGLGQILLTSEEDLSKHVCEKRLPAGIIYQHAPIGTRSVIRRFLDHWRPDMVLWASPKLTFRVLHEFRKNQKSMVWLDIRLTLRDRRFWRLKQNYVRSLYGRFDLFLCQDRMTQKLLRSMGVEGKKTKVIGSFTGGGTAPGDDKFRRAEWSSCLKDRQIWLAAHVPPGELNTVYDAFTKAKRQAHRLLMVLHTNSARPDGLRGDQLFISNNPDPKEYDRAWDVIIIPQSQIGMWYRIAPVTYLGGNLSEGDSQNPFAPAALGSALLTGPTWSRYRDLYDRLNHRTALEIVAGSQSLARAVVQTLPPDRAAMLAHAAWDVSTEGAKVADDAVRATSALFDKQLDLDEAA